jgi:MoxR-like ATPase
MSKSSTMDSAKNDSQAVRERINVFRKALGRHFVARQHVIDLMTTCAVMQEPLLLVGVPGTAKSDLVLKFRDALGVPDTEYFEYMLTKFTEPSEIFGPIDINQMREGRYVRRIEGKLPTATLLFLDEIMKSNSAILNALLTVLNERKYYQDGQPIPVAMKLFFAATNEVPEQAELAALKDRFVFKVACRPVSDEHFLELVDAGLESQTCRDLGIKPWAEGHATLDDFLAAHKYLTKAFSAKTADRDGKEKRDRDFFFPEGMLQEMRRVLRVLTREDNVFISDRKIVKLYRLLRAHAWIHRGGVVEREDLGLLRYLGETKDEIDLLEEKVPKLLGL